MFNFTRDDNSSNFNRHAPYRMTTLRHNPYVGSFHIKNLHLEDPSSANVLMESKNNAMIGVFRHSPSIASKALGLKGILNNSGRASTAVSQLQTNRKKPVRRTSKSNFLTTIRNIPKSKYSASVGGESQNSLTTERRKSDEVPLCSICLEAYQDGDEIMNLACSHCFHEKCVSTWFFQGCLDNDENSSFKCPECRQDHNELKTSESHQEISTMSFFQVGQNLMAEGGYDFLSDLSDTHSVLGSASKRSPPAGLNSPNTCMNVRKGSTTGMTQLPLVTKQQQEEIGMSSIVGIASNSMMNNMANNNSTNASLYVSATTDTNSILQHSTMSHIDRKFGALSIMTEVIPEESTILVNANEDDNNKHDDIIEGSDVVFNTTAAAESPSKDTIILNSSISRLAIDVPLSYASNSNTNDLMDNSNNNNSSGKILMMTNTSFYNNNNNMMMTESGYSDCGVPLIMKGTARK